MTGGPADPGRLRIAVALPQDVTGPTVPAGSLQRFARRAERLGFDGLWTQESLGGAVRTLEPLTALTAAAAVTSRVELGVAVILSIYRNPVQLARMTATLDQLSGGRLVLGVGLGSLWLDEPFRVPSERRVRAFLDGVELVRRLWRDERVTAEGFAWRLADWPSGLRPARSGGPPIWIGAHHPNGIRRAVRIADGWIGAGGSSSTDFLRGLEIVRDALAERGPSGGRFAVGKRVYLTVTRRPRPARDRLRDWFAERYRDPDRADRVALVADPAGLIEELSPLIAAGADLLLLNPLFEQERQLEVLAAEVVPALRALASGPTAPADDGR